MDSDVVTKTTCPYCGVGCGLEITRRFDGAVDVRGDKSHPANFGRLCSKGAALGETIGREGRALRPRFYGKDIDWDTALDTVAQRFGTVIAKHGPDAVAFYVSGQLLTEDYYVANKLMKGFIGSGNIDTNSRLCMSSSVAGHKRAFGSDTVPGNYSDLEQADLVVLTGSNLAWCHPVLYQRLYRAKQSRPAMKVVIIDPRRTATCDLADLHLPIASGTDAVLFSGLLARLSDCGLTNQRFVAEHTQGIDAALKNARWYAPSALAVAEHCGLEKQAVETFFSWFADTEKTVTVYSQGINQSSSGTDKVNAIINCHLLTGRIGRPGLGPFSVTGQPNAMGGREVGALANQLAAHMDFDNPDHLDRLRRFWKTEHVARTPGLKAVDLFRAVERGEVKALWIMATNPAVSLPDANQVRRALAQCEFLVVSDCVSSTDTSAHAHLLLPAQAWGEKAGTVTNSERAISRQRPFMTAPVEAKPDWWIVSQVAQRMGYSGFDYALPHEVFKEHAKLSAFENNGERDFHIGGLADLSDANYEDLTPINWPIPAVKTTGTPRLFGNGRFYTGNGRARFVPIIPRPPGTPATSTYPLLLNTGRVRDQWHTMTRTGKAPRLTGHTSEAYVELHKFDAQRYGLNDGELARVSSRWGEAILRVRVGESQPVGQVFAPIHWNDQFASDARVGALVNPIVDPDSGQPEFKHTPVRVVAFRPVWHGFVLTDRATALDWATYWTRTRRDGVWHYEIAGEILPGDWSSCARTTMLVDRADLAWSELFDSAQYQYRGAAFANDRLVGCIFIGPDYRLPERDWLIELFSNQRLSRRERLRVLAGTPGAGQEDAGRTICSCFNVGRHTLLKGIRERGLNTPERLGEALHAGTNCGSCIPELRTLITEASTD